MNTMNIRISSNTPLTAEQYDKLFEAIHTFGAIDEGFDPQFILVDSSDSEEEPCDCESSEEESTCECQGGCCRKMPDNEDASDCEEEFAAFIADAIDEAINQKFKEELHPQINALMTRALEVSNALVERYKRLSLRLKKLETQVSETLFKTKTADNIPVVGVTERRGRKAKRPTDKDC